MKKSRIYFFYGLLIIGFLVLIGRLFELQIIFGFKNRAMAEGNRIRKIVNPAPRGIIYDRHDKPLVRNVPVYREKVQRCRGAEGQSEGCFELVTREEALDLEAKGETENLRMDIGRDYVYGQVLAHVLGYLGEVNEEEVRSVPMKSRILDEVGRKWKAGDLVGRTGIEQTYDEILRGQDGGEIFEVDNQERKTRMVGKIEPVSGQDLRLSIDSELSEAAYQALAERPGAVVAVEAKTGRVLVLVSSPSFNPDSLRSEELSDPLKPLFNRAIGGVYPPGSAFKIVTATAGIEEEKVDENTVYEDTGQIKIGEYVYKNWYFTQYGRTEGEISLVQAIKRSTDTFFYKIGEWVGATQLAAWGKAFGLGRKTGIDIPGEAEGLVPDPEWKEKTFGERWFLGNTYHFAIGQADLLATPLQVNMMTSVIANDGKLCSPRIAEDTHDRELLMQKENCQDLHLKEETLRLIKEGMKEACSSGGTAFPFFDFFVSGLPANESQHEPYTDSIEKASAKTGRVACKTGTAEFDDPQDRTHAWLTAFAPVDDPEIVVTALVEAGGEGAYVAAPIVKKVMEVWFGLDTSEVAG